ncbi:MAG: hypothetical protein ACOC1X_03785, partial [Promethearchaeota archaeon]
MNNRRKQIGLLIVCLFIFSFALSLNNIKAFQTDDDLQVKLHGKLVSDTSEIDPDSEFLNSKQNYTFFEDPRLDLSEFSHDVSNLDI